MKQPLTHSLPAKVMGVFLMVILAVLLALSGACTLGGVHYGIYDRGVTSYYETNDCRSEMIADLHSIYYLMESGVTDLSETGYFNDFDSCNLRFAGYCFRTGQYLSNDARMRQAMEQIVAAKLLSSAEFQLKYTEEASDGKYIIKDMGAVAPDEDPHVGRSEDNMLLPRTIQWDINDTYFIAGVVSPLTARDAYFRQGRLFDLVYRLRAAAPIVCILCAFAAVADLIFLCCAAGHRRGKEEITLNLQDRIPLDFYLFGMGCAGYVFCLLADDLACRYNDDLIWFVCCVLLFIGLLLLCLAVLLSLCTRIKKGKWWRNTVIWWCGSLFFRICRAIGRGVRGFFRLLPLVWRATALTCLLLFAQTMLTLLMFDSGDPAEWFLVTIVFDGLVVLTAMVVSRHLQLLRRAGEALALGDFDRQIDTSRMRGSLREHGEHLNSLGQGLSIAVEQKMRSERMKTELITNVSHDIKTPLTSIVNYVDLLQKDPTEEERAEYLSVLDRQAKRLKKLTEDLVEASKASTGNLSCNPVPTSLREMLDQAVGEYEDRLQSAGLETVVALPEGDLTVVADGRLLWRVLDNLLNNACKYALPGTRVYLEAKAEDDQARITVKNISRQQLNLSPDELMERFVRGDSSRNTEGSGLGLNIARSLVELQKGTFALSIDGDLFKVVLTLPLWEGRPTE